MRSKELKKLLRTFGIYDIVKFDGMVGAVAKQLAFCATYRGFDPHLYSQQVVVPIWGMFS